MTGFQSSPAVAVSLWQSRRSLHYARSCGLTHCPALVHSLFNTRLLSDIICTRKSLNGGGFSSKRIIFPYSRLGSTMGSSVVWDGIHRITGVVAEACFTMTGFLRNSPGLFPVLARRINTADRDKTIFSFRRFVTTIRSVTLITLFSLA